jgi:hypothetical protein
MANIPLQSDLSIDDILSIEHDLYIRTIHESGIPLWVLDLYSSSCVLQEERQPRPCYNPICPCDEESREECPCFNGTICTCTEKDFEEWEDYGGHWDDEEE